MPASLRTPASLTYLVVGLLVFLVTVAVPLSGVFDVPDVDDAQGETTTGKILRLVDAVTEEGPRGEQTTSTFEVETAGKVVEVRHVEAALDTVQIHYEPGDAVLVTRSAGPDGDVYRLTDYARGFPLWTLAIAFGLFVVVVARVQGALSLLGMVLSLAVILRFIIPGIVSGADPVLISLIGATVILASSLFLSHGVNAKTAVALGGTAVSLAVTAALASFAIDFARLSGLADEHSATLQIITNGNINPEGLLLGGIIIGALGVLDDVTVAQASAVFQLRRANRALPLAGLYSRAMVIGRDHISSTVNTLFLAYAGAALPLLIILSLGTEPAGILLHRDFLATEIVRTLVGSIGIVAAVPVTTAVAAWAALRFDIEEDGDGHGHVHTRLPGPVDTPFR